MKKLTVRDISFMSMYASLIIALSFIPNIGYVPVGTIRIVIIPSFIAIASYHLGLKGALATSLTFGITSYLVSISIYASPINDPFALIVSRLLLGLIIFINMKLMGKMKQWKLVVLTVEAAFLNTVLLTIFLPISSLWMNLPIFDNADSLKPWILMIWTGSLIEIGIAFGIGVVMYVPLIHLIKNEREHTVITW